MMHHLSEFIDSKVIYDMVNNYYKGIGINNEWGLWTHIHYKNGQN